MTTNMVSPTRPLRHVNVVTVEKRSPRARTISIDETLILKNAFCENPPASASRKRGAATPLEAAFDEEPPCGAGACAPRRLDFGFAGADAESDDDDELSASDYAARSPPPRQTRPFHCYRAPPTVRRKTCVAPAWGGASPGTPEAPRLASVDPEKVDKLKELCAANLRCFAGGADGLAVQLQLKELRGRLRAYAEEQLPAWRALDESAADAFHEKATVRSAASPPRTP